MAQQPFMPPEAYPAEKYESGWRKNPFTLKTAPVAVQRESFAKNLALGSMYDDAEGITSVVVVNTKTRERTRLHGKTPAGTGMRVEEAVIADTRRDSYAVVTLGGEKATLRYDEAYLKQMAAGGGAANQNTNVAAAAVGKKNGAGGPGAGATPDMMVDPSAAGAASPDPNAGAAMPPRAPVNTNGSPTPVPPGVRMPGPGMPVSGRPTPPSRRRLTAPISQTPAPQMEAPPVMSPDLMANP